MSIATYNYQIIPGQPTLLPICDVLLLGRVERASVRAVIDSGAEFPIFPRKAAEDAGIELPKVANSFVQYGGGRSLAWTQRVNVELASRRLDIDVWFVERLELPYALLGRRGVFASFKEIAFIEKSFTPRVEFRW